MLIPDRGQGRDDTHTMSAPVFMRQPLESELKTAGYATTYHRRTQLTTRETRDVMS